jgi:hypothetical protein
MAASKVGEQLGPATIPVWYQRIGCSCTGAATHTGMCRVQGLRQQYAQTAWNGTGHRREVQHKRTETQLHAHKQPRHPTAPAPPCHQLKESNKTGCVNRSSPRQHWHPTTRTAAIWVQSKTSQLPACTCDKPGCATVSLLQPDQPHGDCPMVTAESAHRIHLARQ